MKFKSLAIALCTLGLVTSVPPMEIAAAQTRFASIEEERKQWQAEDIERSKVCDRVFQAEANDSFEGNSFFDDFKGLNLTDEQRSAYDALSAQADKKRAEAYQNTVSIVDPTATLSFGWSEWDLNLVPQDVQTAVQAALDKSPKFDQKAALDREFSQYGEFYGSYITYVTPEQEAQLAQVTEDFYTQFQNIMTPEQLPQYRENLAARRRINEVCDVKGPISAYPAMGRVVDSIPELLQ